MEEKKKPTMEEMRAQAPAELKAEIDFFLECEKARKQLEKSGELRTLILNQQHTPHLHQKTQNNMTAEEQKKVDIAFYEECKKAYLEMHKSGELNTLIKESLWPTVISTN